VRRIFNLANQTPLLYNGRGFAQPFTPFYDVVLCIHYASQFIIFISFI